MANFMNREDVEALRAYVVGPDSGFASRGESTVLIHVTHSNLKAKFMEIRLDMHATIETVKVKLSFHCGTSPSSMVLALLDESGASVATMWEDHRKLGYYSPRDGYTIHITDTDPGSASAGGGLEDTSLVEKYRMSDDEYNKREKTYRNWKSEKLARDPSWTLEKEMATRRGVEYIPPAPKVEDPDYMADLAAAITVGQRCSVDPGDRRGEVMFVGRVEGLPLGFWVGIKYDEPYGKNDGSLKGHKYFDALQGYGGFVRPHMVHVGDFPLIDEFAEEGLGNDEI